MKKCKLKFKGVALNLSNTGEYFDIYRNCPTRPQKPGQLDVECGPENFVDPADTAHVAVS